MRTKRKLIANTYIHHGEIVYRLWEYKAGRYRPLHSSRNRKHLLEVARVCAEHWGLELKDETR